MMITKKSMRVLFGILVISAWVLGSAIQAGAETMKLKVSNVVTKGESYPVGDVEGHNLLFLMRDGVVALENGEVGSMKALVISNVMPNGGSFLGYLILTFTDGSTIVLNWQPGTFSPDPERKFASIQQASGELVNGSGRFKGIKGTISMTGKVFKPMKGEVSGKSYMDFTLNYTLP
jgi:hypothetical protein